MTQQSSDYRLDHTEGPVREDRSQAAAKAKRESAKNAVERTHVFAERTAEQLREYGEKAQDAARNFQPFLRNSMKEQPIATLATASLVGFVLGALWKK